MDRRTRYPVEVRERAVRMVFEHGPEYDSQYAAMRSIAASTKESDFTDTKRPPVR